MEPGMTEGRDKSVKADDTPKTNAPAGPLPSAHGNARRRLLKAGVVAVPLLVTLKSRPLYAQSSLGSLGIEYGLYLQGGQAAIRNPEFNGSQPESDDNQKLIADPNGNDRRADTDDDD
jgi:hypothetical protein